MKKVNFVKLYLCLLTVLSLSTWAMANTQILTNEMSVANEDVVRKVVEEAQNFGLSISPENVSVTTDRDGVFAFVPLTGGEIRTTTDALQQGVDVYFGYVRQTNGQELFYKAKMTGTAGNLQTIVVDRDGNEIAHEPLNPNALNPSVGETKPNKEESLQDIWRLRQTIFIWGPVHLYIDGFYVGTFSWLRIRIYECC